MNIKSLFNLITVLLSAAIIISCAKAKPLTEPAAEPRATATVPVPTPTPAHDFESGITGWLRVTTGDQQGITAVAHDTTGTSTTAYSGSSGSLRATCAFSGALVAGNNFAKGAVYTDPALPLDLTGKKIIFRVYVPADLIVTPAYGIQLFIKSTGSWTWADGGWNNVGAAGWQTYEWDLAASPPAAGDVTDVREIGLQLGKGSGSPDWSGNIWVDDVVY